jgi:hypothetical protein
MDVQMRTRTPRRQPAGVWSGESQSHHLVVVGDDVPVRDRQRRGAVELAWRRHLPNVS